MFNIPGMLLTNQADTVDDEFFSSIWRQQEWREDEEHDDQTGEDDARPVGGRVSLEVEGEGDIRIGLLDSGILVRVGSK